MPYEIETKDGIVIRNIPDDIAPDHPSLKQRVASIRAANDYGRPQENAVSPANPAIETLKDVAKQYGNYSAGTLRGAGSIGSTLLWPIDKATDIIKGDRDGMPSRNEERRQQIDAGLQSMGADPQSIPYQGGKLVGEIAGTAGTGSLMANALRAVPGAAAAAPRLMQSIESAGMTTGGNVAPGMANIARDLLTRASGGAVSGGAQAGLIEPQQAGFGAGIGATVPIALAPIAGAGRFIGGLTKGGSERNALNKIIDALKGDTQQAIGDIQTYYPKGAENIPLSTAAITKNPSLARLEQGSRLKVTEPWYEFDQKQGKAVFENVTNATKEADLIGERAATRRSNWDEAWAKAKDSEKPKIWKWGMERLRMDLDQAMTAPEASNPSVKAAIQQIAGEIDRVGPAFSPSHLQQLRAELNGKVNPLDSSLTLKTAPRDNPAIISIKNELDRILNAATGGKWQKVLEGYTADSVSLNQARAAEKVRSRFVDRETGRVLGKSLDPMGDVPTITESGLGNALNQARAGDKSLALSDEAANRLQATIDALRGQGIVQGVKRSASAGGGSDTVSNAEAVMGHGASIASGHRGGGIMAIGLAKALKQLSVTRTDKELATLLSNPDKLAAALINFQKPVSNSGISEFVYRSAPALAANR